MTYLKFRRLFVIATFLFATTALVAEQAELKVEVKPKEAFVFVDGKPFAHHPTKMELAPGEHTIGVFNYGFIPQVKTVTLKEGDNPELEITLQPTGDPVKGPWGRLRIEDVHNRDAVFLNGKTTDFFVGHVDETTSHALLGQKMVLPPGTHQVTIVDPRMGKEIFSGPVEIVANRETILDAEKGTVRFEAWKDGSAIHSLPRFSSSSSETIVAVAPVTGNLAIEPAGINCGQPARLIWNATDAVESTITANGVPLNAVAVSGELPVSPKETTTYEFKTIGPGGVFVTRQTLRVNNVIQTSLLASPAELRFHKVGDNVLEQGTSTLRWTASNADNVRIDPIGAVTGTAGEESIAGLPSATANGPVAEMKTYRITATNACGGSDTSTASVHITGSIDPEVAEAKPPELPQTASPLPLIGLLGFGSLASGVVLRRFRKNR
jgi:LPXTG-motif cell wall-anchored protein